MDIRYYKEQHHNYMVIKSTEPEQAVTFQQKMLASRRMEYLLASNTRSLDGEEYNYYDISSLLSLSQMHGSRSFDLTDINELMRALGSACDEIDRYLLDVGRLCLDPDLIFCSRTGHRYYFMYNVSTGPEENAEGFGRLMDYLLERVSPDDAAAGELVYTMYEYYEKGGRDIWDIVAMADPGQMEEPSAEAVFNGSGRGSAENACDVRNRVLTEACPDERNVSPEASPDILPSCEGYHFDGPDDAAGIYERAGKSRVSDYIPAVAGALGLVGCIAVYLLMRLTADEKMILVGCACMAAALAAYGLFRIFRNRIRKRVPAAAFGEPEPAEYGQMPDHPADVDIRMESFVAGPSGMGAVHARKPRILAAGETADTPCDGQTVFFEDTAAGGSYKLYACDRKNKKHIELDRLPCTIGKLNGYVDFCLDDPSISRMHARIDLDNDRLVLSDLNSTNGVFINGIRLSPNESRVIEAGDEIRFGNLNYCLRHCG